VLALVIRIADFPFRQDVFGKNVLMTVQGDICLLNLNVGLLAVSVLFWASAGGGRRGGV
jgi:hypothetical protein